MKKKIILASASPRRKILLAKAGVVFDVVPSDYEEDMNLSFAPRELAVHLSQGKAESVAKRYPGAIIISADTFVVYEGKIIGKPHAPEKAKKILHMLSGGSHSVITGFTVMEAGGKRISCAEETKVFFKNLTDETIDAYIATGEPLDKAGAYAAQELGGALVLRIEGDIENVVGLPTKKVLAVLKNFGFWNEMRRSPDPPVPEYKLLSMAEMVRTKQKENAIDKDSEFIKEVAEIKSV